MSHTDRKTVTVLSGYNSTEWTDSDTLSGHGRINSSNYITTSIKQSLLFVAEKMSNIRHLPIKTRVPGRRAWL